jgi:long-chain fatty acid transport protein
MGRWALTAASRRTAGGALVLVALTSGATADPVHRPNVIVGGRAAGMGGAFTALADDGSGGHYNPAGLATLPGASFSLSTSLYGLHTEEVGGADSIRHYDLFDFQTIPGAAVTVKELYEGEDDGRYRVTGAFSVFVTDHESSSRTLVLQDVPGRTSEGEEVVFDRFVHSSARSFETLEGALSVGFRVAPWLDLGMSLNVVYRSIVRDEVYDVSRQDGDLQRFFRLHLKLDGAWVGLAGSFGVHSNPWEGLHLGVNLRTPAARVYSDAEIGGTLWVSSGAPAIDRFPDSTVSMEHKLAPELVFGAAYEVPRVLAFSVDLALRLPMESYVDISDPDFGRLIDRNFTWDIAVGAEIWPIDLLAVRVGFYTNHTSGGPGDPQLDPAPAFDELGITTGVGFDFGGATLSLGTTYQWGEGPFLPLGRFGVEVAERAASTFRTYLSTTYSF